MLVSEQEEMDWVNEDRLWREERAKKYKKRIEEDPSRFIKCTVHLHVLDGEELVAEGYQPQEIWFDLHSRYNVEPICFTNANPGWGQLFFMDFRCEGMELLWCNLGAPELTEEEWPITTAEELTFNIETIKLKEFLLKRLLEKRNAVTQS